MLQCKLGQRPFTLFEVAWSHQTLTSGCWTTWQPHIRSWFLSVRLSGRYLSTPNSANISPVRVIRYTTCLEKRRKAARQLGMSRYSAIRCVIDHISYSCLATGTCIHRVCVCFVFNTTKGATRLHFSTSYRLASLPNVWADLGNAL